MVEPANGVVPPEWDGSVTLEVHTASPFSKLKNLIDLELVQNGNSLTYMPPDLDAFLLLSIPEFDITQFDEIEEQILITVRDQLVNKNIILTEAATVQPEIHPDGSSLWRINEADIVLVVKWTNADSSIQVYK